MSLKSIEDIKLNTWYSSDNVLFKMLSLNKNGRFVSKSGTLPVYTMIYIQTVDHLGTLANKVYLNWDMDSWGAFDTYDSIDKKEYIYNERTQLRINIEEIETPTSSDFRAAMKGVFTLGIAIE